VTGGTELKWASLDHWGSGEVEVSYSWNYPLYSGSNTVTYTSAEALCGVVLDEPQPDWLTSVTVRKWVNNQWVTLYSQSGNADVQQGQRLILRGATAGLSGIEIEGVGFRAATALGADVYAVDISGLSRGRYSYTPVGTVSLIGGSFEVRGTGGGAVVQEVGGFLDFDWGSGVELKWSSLERFGPGDVEVSYQGVGLDRNASKTERYTASDAMCGVTLAGTIPLTLHNIAIRKWIDNQWVTLYSQVDYTDVYNPHLEISGVDSNVASVTFEYRSLGSTGGFLSKTASQMGPGWWSVNYDDMANGQYEYRLVVDGVVGATETLDIARGGTLVPKNPEVTTTYTPTLSQIFDRWGNVLSVSDPRDSSRVTTYRYNHLNQVTMEKKPAADVVTASGLPVHVTSTTNTYYDANGRAIRVRDPNGNNSVRHYDEAGQLITEYDGAGGIVQHQYDALGRESARIDGNNQITQFTYDRNNRLVKDQLLLSANHYCYDEAGNRIQVTNGENESTDQTQAGRCSWI
jgi:YD repeat-containing protein